MVARGTIAFDHTAVLPSIKGGFPPASFLTLRDALAYAEQMLLTMKVGAVMVSAYSFDKAWSRL